MDRRVFLCAVPVCAVGVRLLGTGRLVGGELRLESVDDVHDAFTIGEVYSLNGERARRYLVSAVSGSTVTFTEIGPVFGGGPRSAWSAGSVVVRGHDFSAPPVSTATSPTPPALPRGDGPSAPLDPQRAAKCAFDLWQGLESLRWIFERAPSGTR